MRWLILPVVLLVVQLLTYGLSVFVHWLLRPYVHIALMPILVVVFLLSNGLILAAFLGYFRLSATWLGVLWIGFLALCVAFGLIFVLNKTGILPNHPILPRVIALFCVGAFLGYSVYNAYSPVVRRVHIALDKPIPAPVVFGVASDLHLGSLVGVGQLNKLTKLIHENQIDVLLLPGDIMDDDTVAFEAHKMAAPLHDAFSQSAVTVASLGNHDLYQTQAYASITQAIVDAGAILLNDQAVQLTITKDGKSTQLAVIGRFDDHKADRKSTQELLSGVNTDQMVVLLDHRPSQIEQNSQLPIDLQVSGHTHKGQVFPANFIVSAINRIGYGYEKINDTHFVVSSGFGFWGVPLRLGSRAEIWVITVTGKAD